MGNKLSQNEISILSSNTEINGTLKVKNEVHVFGKIIGELRGEVGSQIIIKEGALVEGKIFADFIIIEGFVKGDVTATQSIWVAPHGKIIGNIAAPSLKVDPGAIFEAKVHMN